jgi:hypothetical protein
MEKHVLDKGERKMKTECILISIRRKRGSDQFQWVIVHGWATGLPGLYVTLDYVSAMNGFKRYGYTHVSSGVGFHCGNLRCKRTAIRYARKHFGVIDWTLDKDHVTMHPDAIEMYRRSTQDLVFK